MARKSTIQKVRVAALVEAALIERVDAERQEKGRCSRALIIRMALQDRYREPQTTA